MAFFSSSSSFSKSLLSEEEVSEEEKSEDKTLAELETKTDEFTLPDVLFVDFVVLSCCDKVDVSSETLNTDDETFSLEEVLDVYDFPPKILKQPTVHTVSVIIIKTITIFLNGMSPPIQLDFTSYTIRKTREKVWQICGNCILNEKNM